MLLYSENSSYSLQIQISTLWRKFSKLWSLVAKYRKMWKLYIILCSHVSPGCKIPNKTIIKLWFLFPGVIMIWFAINIIPNSNVCLTVEWSIDLIANKWTTFYEPISWTIIPWLIHPGYSREISCRLFWKPTADEHLN